MYTTDPGPDIDRLIDQVLGAQDVAGPQPQVIPIDLCRSGQRYVVSADLPGVDPASIELHVDRCALTIKARRTCRSSQTDEWLLSERCYGTFERHLILNDQVDAENLQVGYHNGVLNVSIPITENPDLAPAT